VDLGVISLLARHRRLELRLGRVLGAGQVVVVSVRLVLLLVFFHHLAFLITFFYLHFLFFKVNFQSPPNRE
jgi:hypothetical protein